MLYDPKWDKPSVAGFKAWLERQNPSETFCFMDCSGCAAGQYLRSLGTSYHEADTLILMGLNLFAMKAMQAARPADPTFGAVLREIEHAEAA